MLCASFDFVHSLHHMDQSGLLYAQTIAKVFGFRHIENYYKIVPLYLKERQKYMKFYEA